MTATVVSRLPISSPQHAHPVRTVGPVKGAVTWMPRLRMAAAALLVAVGVAVVSIGTQVVGASAAHADTCGPIPCPSIADVGCALLPSACVAGTVIGGVSSQIGDAVSTAAAAFLAVLVRGAADGVQAVLSGVSKFMTSSTRPNVTADSFVGADGPYHKVAQLSALLMILFLFFAVIQGTLSGQPGEMVARFGKAVPLAVLAIVALPWLVDQLLSLVDAMCAWLLPTGATMTTLAKVYAGDQLQATLSGGFASLPVLLLEVFVWLGGLLIYAELVVRDALVLVTVALAPLSFAAMVWPAARGAARRAAELLAAVILSKLAIWVALLVGIDLFQKQAFSPGPDAWGQMIVGAAVLAVAIFAPFVVWRLLPVAEAAVIAQGLSRQPGRAAQNSMYVANSAQNMMSRFGRSGGGGGGGHPSQSSSQPSQLPTRSLGAPGGGGSGGPPGPKGPAGTPGPAATSGGAAAGGGAAGGAAGGGAAAGGAAAGGAAAGGAAAAGPAAVVAVPVAAAKAAKDKATSSGDAQSAQSGSSSGWGFSGNGGGQK